MIADDAIGRFWPKTGAQTIGDCIVWIGAESEGRGRFRADGKAHLSHRFLYERALGPIPNGKVVMHACDNGLCVKLQHLDIGTQKQNIRDAQAKGRLVGNRTRTRPLRKISANDVAAIRVRHAAGSNARDLALEYGLSEGHVYRILDLKRSRR